MKTAILITDQVKQIMFTAENDAEKEALSYISPDDDIHTVIKVGTFVDARHDRVFGANVYECQGGYYRAEEQENSVMFVLTPKTKK
jgi:hypothetical protein